MATYIDERGDRVASAEADKKVRATTTEARQGPLGKPIFIVLVCGLLLALVAWAGAEIFGESTDNDAATETQQVTPAETATDAPTTPSSDVQQPAPVDQDPTPQSGTGG
ncbi:hypothetical protein [Pararhizobium arenae]|uniref:hypothetical protein n=1 Tax=Pararhizobium arenae TaxID=1856850 RepID=UPI00094AFB22|nr:hypothetical protein [Pararhizobium arenae]